MAGLPQDRTYVATVAADGTATIEVRVWGRSWLIQQVSTEYLTAPSGCQCFVRKRGSLITPMIAAADVAAGDPPIVLADGEPLTITWTAATPGEQAQATVVYTLLD